VQSFFKRSDKPEAPNRINDIECVTRALADTFFILNDWDQALSHYKLILEDLKSKTPKIYYNCLEMKFLAGAFQDTPAARKEIDIMLEMIYKGYIQTEESKIFAAKIVLLSVYFFGMCMTS
jgi:hypothetical protein